MTATCGIACFPYHEKCRDKFPTNDKGHSEEWPLSLNLLVGTE